MEEQNEDQERDGLLLTSVLFLIVAIRKLIFCLYWLVWRTKVGKRHCRLFLAIIIAWFAIFYVHGIVMELNSRAR